MSIDNDNIYTCTGMFNILIISLDSLNFHVSGKKGKK